MRNQANFAKTKQAPIARVTPIKELKAKLLALGYPWPEHLVGKSRSWLQTEIRLITPLPRDKNERAAKGRRPDL
jgi:hypothetical protein